MKVVLSNMTPDKSQVQNTFKQILLQMLQQNTEMHYTLQFGPGGLTLMTIFTSLKITGRPKGQMISKIIGRFII